MDPRVRYSGFNAYPNAPNAFINTCNNESSTSTPNFSTDTILRLDSSSHLFPSFSPSTKGTKRKWGDSIVESSLFLGIGRSPTSSDSKGSSATTYTLTSARETDEETSMDLGLNFQLHLGNDMIISPKASSLSQALSSKPIGNSPKTTKIDIDLNSHFQLSLSTGAAQSDLTCLHEQRNTHAAMFDDGSTSSRWTSGGLLRPYIEKSAAASPSPSPSWDLNLTYSKEDPTMAAPEPLETIVSPASKSSLTYGSAHVRSSVTKTCQFPGCVKGARGASGHCIAHGGGRRCQRPGCQKGAEGRTACCKAHGGGRRCQHLGCTKSAEGRTEYCIAHGGGRRCGFEGECCTKAARGKSGLCIKHGGGKRCQMDNCTKSAEGQSGLCISHGGGRRCHYPDCTKGAQGSTDFCKAHGGGKRCSALGCTKGAEGSTPLCKAHGGGKRCSFEGCSKSVHGGTKFCVAHGGGKRCKFPDCTKSARGKTEFCVRHGGGKRCKVDDCGKSAQGSTDFCKAHGGGKRCTWTQENVEAPCDKFARGKNGLCASHYALVHDKRVHGGGTLSKTSPVANTLNLDDRVASLSELSRGLMHATPRISSRFCDNAFVSGTQETVVSNLHGYAGPAASLQFTMKIQSPIVDKSAAVAVAALPEGRVHGGNLMAMLARDAV